MCLREQRMCLCVSTSKACFQEAKQVVKSDSLLLASKQGPRRVKQGYAWLASSYLALVRQNVKAGLHCFKKPHQVAHQRGVQQHTCAVHWGAARFEKTCSTLLSPFANR